MAYVVTAVWIAKPGQEDAVTDILRQLVPASRAEPGCRIYQPYRDAAEPQVFRLFEVYDDEAAFQAHFESEHFQRLVLGEAIPLLDGRERAFYETFGDL
jgi:quinol monooxygenase YgiN